MQAYWSNKLTLLLKMFTIMKNVDLFWTVNQYSDKSLNSNYVLYASLKIISQIFKQLKIVDWHLVELING